MRGVPGAVAEASVSTECAFAGMPSELPGDESISNARHPLPSSRSIAAKRSAGTLRSFVNRRPSAQSPSPLGDAPPPPR